MKDGGRIQEGRRQVGGRSETSRRKVGDKSEEGRMNFTQMGNQMDGRIQNFGEQNQETFDSNHI
jgi:monoamine oxidase